MRWATRVGARAFAGIASLGLCIACPSGSAPRAPGSVTVSIPAALAPPTATTAAPGASATPPSDVVECRSPEQPGCNPCWLPQVDGTCRFRAWQGGPLLSDQEKARWEKTLGRPLTPWYNAESVQPKCPEHFSRCAACSDRDEWEITQLANRPECDCKQPTGDDPCFDPGSCGCHCEHKLGLMQKCPGRFPRDVPAKTALMRFGAILVTGPLAPEAIQRVVREEEPRLLPCYEDALRKSPGLAGRVLVRFDIDLKGHVTSLTSGGSDIPNAELIRCVVDDLRPLTFPRPNGATVTVVYPFLFAER